MIREIQGICEILGKGEFTTGPLNDLLNKKQTPINIYELAKKLNLIITEGKNTKITDKGIMFFSMSESISKLTDEQKKFIFESCILGNKKLENVNDFLMNFKHDGDFIYKLFDDEIDGNDIQTENTIFSLLEELDVIERNVDESSYEINKIFVKILNKHNLSNEIRKKQPKTQEGLDLSLKERKRIGEIGEKLALRYERRMLKEEGWTNRLNDFDELNSKGNLVAKADLEAGYDISSFKAKDSGSVDKYIEVKSRKAKEKSFIISEPEILAGQKYSKIKNSYFIYFYYNLGKEEPEEPTKIIPFEKLRIEMCEKCPGLFQPSYKIDIDYLFKKN